jgi:hypothetical protein
LHVNYNCFKNPKIDFFLNQEISAERERSLTWLLQLCLRHKQTKLRSMPIWNPSLNISPEWRCITITQLNCKPRIGSLSLILHTVLELYVHYLNSQPLWHRQRKLKSFSHYNSNCFTLKGTRRESITVRGQTYVSRLPKYWPPTPLSARRVCPPPATKGTHSPGGEGDKGSVFYFGRWEK